MEADQVKKVKKIIRWTWLSLAAISVILFLVYRDNFTAENLKSAFNDNAGLILTLYIILSCVRAMLFLPSTPFILVGTALYPDSPILVLCISMAGILIGASLVYKSASFLAPESLFTGKTLTRMEGVHRKMEKHGFFIVLLWSFFPAVPTDLICFVAGTIRMSFLKFISALFLGELVLVCLYIWTGKAILELLF